MNKLENLKRELDVIVLEDRLEMVAVTAQPTETQGNNVCCCNS